MTLRKNEKRKHHMMYRTEPSDIEGFSKSLCDASAPEGFSKSLCDASAPEGFSEQIISVLNEPSRMDYLVTWAEDIIYRFTGCDEHHIQPCNEEVALKLTAYPQFVPDGAEAVVLYSRQTMLNDTVIETSLVVQYLLGDNDDLIEHVFETTRETINVINAMRIICFIDNRPN